MISARKQVITGDELFRPRVLTPYIRAEAMTLKEAVSLTGRCESTVRNWAAEFDIGRRIGRGPWQISRVALAMFLDGDDRTLRRYLAGDRSSPSVAAYYKRAKVAIPVVG